MGLIPDLRRHFPFVDAAISLRAGDSVAPFARRVLPGEAESLELRTKGRRMPVEKNWAAFYPGARRNPTALYPSISYSVAPAQLMVVDNTTLRAIDYAHVDTGGFAAKCVARAHKWDPSANHQASPLYRFTLCERGCTAHEGNTVNVAVAHAKLRGRQYMKLVGERRV